jgi:hypothetical protein
VSKKKKEYKGRYELREALESARNPTEQKSNADEPVYYFRYSATLRICGDGLDLDEISRTLGLAPTHQHRKGEQVNPRGSDASHVWPHDMWSYKVPIDSERPLEEHIMALWNGIRPHIPYLQDLQRNFELDVFCGYRSNSATAGFQVSHRCLGLFSELKIPFGVSVIIS